MLLWEIVTFGATPLPGMPTQTIVDKAQAGELRHLMYGPVTLLHGITIFHGLPIKCLCFFRYGLMIYSYFLNKI